MWTAVTNGSTRNCARWARRSRGWRNEKTPVPAGPGRTGLRHLEVSRGGQRQNRAAIRLAQAQREGAERDGQAVGRSRPDASPAGLLCSLRQLTRVRPERSDLLVLRHSNSVAQNEPSRYAATG